ncbi:Proline-rich protein PRCC protein [Dioscorea alata]|uniref:Proline-rich protein PRCC protein n=2 Tax=Dioscorea alata TaxID=55571 RepID=A0ACB7VCQ2_DIOAL|nr:Proline-rich protein PRCC protein [Dioscorea alata]KAH7671691.1 Proline-rich protein PRCC protein [Dioscorea alata]
MESLLANYASDDDDEQEMAPNSHPNPNPSSNSLLSSLPPPKSLPKIPSSNLNSSKSDLHDLPKPNSSLFSSLPPPKSAQNPKKVVKFTPPVNFAGLRSTDLDDDDDDEEMEQKSVKISSSNLSKGLAALLPAPKNSLCLAPNSSDASSRRSTLDADVPAISQEGFGSRQEEVSGGSESFVNAPGGENLGFTTSTSTNEASTWDPSYGGGGVEYGDYTENWNDGNYAGNWYEGSETVAEPFPVIPEMEKIGGKRGRSEIPANIVEVKQDELMKNRPRQDQVKLTGIAFGPSYQPVSSGKGKPSKLHKRKHQIGSLYFDMKQKEMELAERRSKGLLTKSETQAKYGW